MKKTPQKGTSKPYIRWQTDTLLKTLSTRRVLILAGPRQCGKTTLVKALANRNTIYRTLDDLTLLNAAQSDPQGFIRHGDELMIIDEVQRAPMLLQAIKQDVDQNQKPGRFLLTGSANIQALPSVTESLAGRVSNIRLRPLVLGEIYDIPAHFLESAFREEFTARTSLHTIRNEIDPAWDKDMYVSDAFLGGFPEARRLINPLDQRAWHEDYINALIERDLKDIANIKRKDSMMKLIEVLSAWSSKFMDIASICKSLSLTRPTVESYINALEALYLVERVRPWHKTDYDRVGKREKLFMSDTGMMVAALRWNFSKARLDGDPHSSSKCNSIGFSRR
jgi:predicted AAA+ superfamily ATPase